MRALQVVFLSLLFVMFCFSCDMRDFLAQAGLVSKWRRDIFSREDIKIVINCGRNNGQWSRVMKIVNVDQVPLVCRSMYSAVTLAPILKLNSTRLGNRQHAELPPRRSIIIDGASEHNSIVYSIVVVM